MRVTVSRPAYLYCIFLDINSIEGHDVKDTASCLMDWIHLCAVPRLGPVGISRLLAAYGSATAVLSLDRATWAKMGLSDRQIKAMSCRPMALIESCLAWQEVSDRHYIVTLASENYPFMLRHIPAPPPILYIKGDPEILFVKQVAIVGSRHASSTGRRYAHAFALALAEVGWQVTSGLALGIDACAHQGALAAGAKTVAVLGSGLTHIYPRKHVGLANQILESGGALLSELPPNTKPLAHHFPRRNRIISGLSRGVLVVEASLRSGSLITARYALEQGREVMALPGSLGNPMAEGVHELIRSGAHLVRHVADVVMALGDSAGLDGLAPCSSLTSNQQPKLDDDCVKLLKCMGFDRLSMDELVHLTGLSLQKAAVCVYNLTEKGVLCCQDGKYYRDN